MNFKVLPVLLFVSVLYAQNVSAQAPEYTRGLIAELCAEKYKGRGYVDDGVNKAAGFLENEFSKLKLRKFNDQYAQSYRFPVNTHPYPVSCSIDEETMVTGRDFLVNPASTSTTGKFELLHFNLKDSIEKILLYKKIRKGFLPDEAIVLHFENQRKNTVEDSCKFYGHIPRLLIYTEEKKLTHGIAKETSEINSITIFDSLIKNKETIEISFMNMMISDFENRNIAGYIKAKKSDSFIVFTAHYDHLGMLGDAMFPGASDNASGTSMILYLARYFSNRKPPCNIVFILFSGEEAGLMGSQYFTTHPTFDLQKIKMLVNIDIMGDAKNGITVVNGEIFPQKFSLLRSINEKHQYLPEVKIRGKAKNSDHYYFSEKGIPSFFIYSMGGAGFYHDIFDKAETLSLTNYEQVARLLIDFVYAL